MSSRDQIKKRPATAQVVIKAHMTKASLDDPMPDWERYGQQAIEWWDCQLKEARQTGFVDENEFAARLIEKMRDQEVWGKILRGDAV